MIGSPRKSAPPNRAGRQLRAGAGLLAGLGLLVSQAGATCLVRHANLALHQAMTAIMAQGYMAVPCPVVVAQLPCWGPGFMGGLFLTLSTGSLIVFATLAALGAARHLFLSPAKRCAFLIVLAAGLAVFLNTDGLNLGATLYALAVMAAVALPGLAMNRTAARQKNALLRIVIVIGPLLLLTGIWLTRMDRNLFVDIRDRLLFSNPAGVGIANFYYDYNLFAAQAIAPLNHRTLIGIDLSGINTAPGRQALADALRGADMLAVGSSPGAAITVKPEANALRWQDSAGRGITVAPQEILATPKPVRERFSKTVDTKAPFRRLTLAGILVGFPVLLYLILFAAVEKTLGLFLGPRAVWAAALVCMAVGSALFYPMMAAPRAGAAADTLAERILQLRQAVRQGTDPLVHTDGERAARSPWPAERYWFARALAGSRSTNGFALAADMAHDENPIIACQACYALGKIGNRKAVPILLGLIQNQNHWYTQRYAYSALRRLGWTQPAPSR